MADLVTAFVTPQSEGHFQQTVASLPAAATTTSQVRNRHDARQMDSLVTLDFGNAELTVYRLSATGRELPLALSVSQPGFSFAGVDVGMSVGLAFERLGETSGVRLDGLGFQLARPHAAPVGIELVAEAGLVSSIILTAYLD